jgi:hypothetical protein
LNGYGWTPTASTGDDDESHTSPSAWGGRSAPAIYGDCGRQRWVGRTAREVGPDRVPRFSGQDGSRCVGIDLRWPWWPSGTYYANWNTGFNPKPNNLTFYAGIQSWMADGPDDAPHPDAALQRAFRPGNTWSLWGYAPGGIPPRFIDVGPTLSMVNAYGGEGTSAYLAALPWPFIKNERWYTMLARVWQPHGRRRDLDSSEWSFGGN